MGKSSSRSSKTFEWQAIDLEREVQGNGTKIANTKTDLPKSSLACTVRIARHNRLVPSLWGDYLKSWPWSDFNNRAPLRPVFGDEEAHPCGFATIGSIVAW